jgi:hypothetical protein
MSDLGYSWFQSLEFDFNAVYPEAPKLESLDKILRERWEQNRGQPYVEGTTFRQDAVVVQRRLFALTEGDLQAQAELAGLIAFAEGKNRCARF